ncbi:MAG TPA: type III-A CRISPR-associated RAMP protein Csm5, partial [Candidatus Kapabacteria bacterium]|nr:type III-A CRISPR-associated RAMP protein Csm5 [Candidatus Kapabacteria bacterium]
MNTESNKFRITTLTPIAISSGEQIDSFEYLIQGNYFYRLKTDEILSYVIKEVPQSIHKISEWVETKDEKLNNQSSSNLKKKGTYKLNIFDFISNHLNRKDLEHTIRQKIKEGKFIRYKMPTNEPNVSKLVNSHIKTADNKIYIPGTTIKGIIRTAILNEYFYKVFTDKEFASEKIEILDKLKSELRECKSQDNKKKKDAKNFFEDEINEIFNYSTKEYDAKYDLMKFVRVSDTNCRLPEEVCELVLPKTLTAKGTAQGQLNALEVIKKGVSFDFTIDFDIEFLRAVEKSIDNKQERDMFYSKLENLFGISKKNMNELSNSLIVEMFSENIMDYLYNYLVGIEKLDDG